MAKGRKQVAFDLDTSALKTYYPSDHWNYAYEVIRRHMTGSGFQWMQGSVYVSKMPITSAEVTNILDELINENPWLNLCMRDCRETNIGKEHSKNHLFDKTIKLKVHSKDKEDMLELVSSVVENEKTFLPQKRIEKQREDIELEI